MSVVAIITTRSASTRFPNKFKADICGKPMLLRIVEEVKQARVDYVVVAGVVGDKPVKDFCHDNEIDVYFGSENDILGRIFMTGCAYKADTIVRIWGDSPLTDHANIDFALRYFYSVYPPYLSMMTDSGAIAVTTLKELDKLDKKLTAPKDREWIHTYQSKRKGSISLEMGTPVTLDTPDNLEKICKLWKSKKSQAVGMS